MPAAMAKAVAKAALFHKGSNPSKNPVKTKLAICRDFSGGSIGVWINGPEVSSGAVVAPTIEASVSDAFAIPAPARVRAHVRHRC